MSSSKNPTSYTEHGIPIRNLWHMLLYAWNEPHMLSQINLGEVESAPTLDALFATILLNRIQQRMRIGLGHGYIAASKRLRGVRGRVDFAESLKQAAFENGEAVCDFQEYSVNEPRNQILRSTLMRLVQAGEFGPDESEAEALRQRLRWLARNLNGVDLIELDPESMRRQVVMQNENDYRLMLSICEMIAMRQMPLEIDGGSALPIIDRQTLFLHRVYERFVANFYKLHLRGWDVHAQKRLDWHAQEANEHLPIMIPDLILHDGATRRVLILDTKFTAGSLVENQWGKPVYDSSHLYQLYTYLRSQEGMSAEYRNAQGILLYPAVHASLSERIELQGHVLHMVCVDLAAKWDEVELQLMKVVTSP